MFDESDYPSHGRRPAYQTGEGSDDVRPLSERLHKTQKILSAAPGSLHRFAEPSQVAPISSYELQIRLANEFRKGSCDPSDPAPDCVVPLDPELFSGYTGLSDPEDLSDEEEFDFRCLIAANRSRLRAEGDEPPDHGGPHGNPYRNAGSRYVDRPTGCDAGDVPSDPYSDPDNDGLTDECPINQLDCRGVGDIGAPDNPISGGLWFDAMDQDTPQ